MADVAAKWLLLVAASACLAASSATPVRRTLLQRSLHQPVAKWHTLLQRSLRQPSTESVLDNTPEHASNVQDFTVVAPLPPVAPHGGTFCRGLGCLRRGDDLGEDPIEEAAEDAATPFFCRGIGCPHGAAVPVVTPEVADFVIACGELLGSATLSSSDAAMHFQTMCSSYLNVNETDHCQDYADPFRAGGAMIEADSCDAMFQFITMMKQAAVDLDLTRASLASFLTPWPSDAMLHAHCDQTMNNISSQFATNVSNVPAMETVRFVKSWCDEQAVAGLKGHPEWDALRCQHMETLVAYAVREELVGDYMFAPLPTSDVCDRLLLAIGSMHRLETIVNEGWPSHPAKLVGPRPPPANDEALVHLVSTSREAHFAAIDTIKEQNAAANAPPPPKVVIPPPTVDAAGGGTDSTMVAPLPSVDDVDLDSTVLTAVRLRRLRGVTGGSS